MRLKNISLLSSLILFACSGTAGRQTISTQFEKANIPVVKPSQINEENVAKAIRRFLDMSPTASEFGETRTKIVQVLLEKHRKMVAAGDSDAAWFAFVDALKLFTIEEIMAGQFAADTEPMARWALKVYSPLGNEVRVMIALIVLTALRPENEDYQNKYRILKDWIIASRDSLADDVERITEIIDIYAKVAKILPVPAVTNKLLQLYSHRHQVFSTTLGSTNFHGFGFGEAYMKYYFMNAAIERTSYDILWLYARMGHPAGAIDSIEKYRGKRGYEPNLVSLLEKLATAPNEAEGWLLLSKVFLDDDSDLALACCRRGWKMDPLDYRFPLCLAEYYRRRGEYDGAEEYFGIARILNDGEPQIYSSNSTGTG